MAEGRWADWQVRQIAENMAEKCPKRDWFDGDDEIILHRLRVGHILQLETYSPWN